MATEMRIFGPVYQVGGPGISHIDDACTYAVDCGDQVVLIDAGSGRGLLAILDNLRALFGDDKPLTWAVATHGHIDHIGGLVYLREKKGVRVAAHEGDAGVIIHGDPEFTASAAYGLYYRGVQLDHKISGASENLNFGNQCLCVLHTPGHTPGSISLFIDSGGKRLLFAQDIQGPFLPQFRSNLEQWGQSIRRLLELEADILLDGHEGPVKGSKRVRQYLEEQLAKTVDG